MEFIVVDDSGAAVNALKSGQVKAAQIETGFAADVGAAGTARDGAIPVDERDIAPLRAERAVAMPIDVIVERDAFEVRPELGAQAVLQLIAIEQSVHEPGGETLRAVERGDVDQLLESRSVDAPRTGNTM